MGAGPRRELVAETLAGLRVEGVLGAFGHGQRDRLAHLRDVLAVDPDDELLVTGVEGGGAVQVRVGAELLGDVDPQVETRLGRRWPR